MAFEPTQPSIPLGPVNEDQLRLRSGGKYGLFLLLPSHFALNLPRLSVITAELGRAAVEVTSQVDGMTQIMGF